MKNNKNAQTPQAPDLSKIEQAVEQKQAPQTLLFTTKMNGYKIFVYQNKDTSLEVKHEQDLQEEKTFNLLTDKGKVKIELQFNKFDDENPFKAFYVVKSWILQYIKNSKKARSLFHKIQRQIKEKNPFESSLEVLKIEPAPSCQIVWNVLDKEWIDYKLKVKDFASYFEQYLQEGQTEKAIEKAFKRRFVSDKDFVWVQEYQKIKDTIFELYKNDKDFEKLIQEYKNKENEND